MPLLIGNDKLCYVSCDNEDGQKIPQSPLVALLDTSHTAVPTISQDQIDTTKKELSNYQDKFPEDVFNTLIYNTTLMEAYKEVNKNFQITHMLFSHAAPGETVNDVKDIIQNIFLTLAKKNFTTKLTDPKKFWKFIMKTRSDIDFETPADFVKYTARKIMESE